MEVMEMVDTEGRGLSRRMMAMEDMEELIWRKIIIT